jgi:hypothetical protein
MLAAPCRLNNSARSTAALGKTHSKLEGFEDKVNMLGSYASHDHRKNLKPSREGLIEAPQLSRH